LIRILCLLGKGYCALEKYTGAKHKNAQGLYRERYSLSRINYFKASMQGWEYSNLCPQDKGIAA
jgi:hypothetical protein